jgi:hypothetical protein
MSATVGKVRNKPAVAKNKRRKNIGLEKQKQKKTISDSPLLYLAHCVISFAQ